jgi:aspartyl-tRNA synthetase
VARVAEPIETLMATLWQEVLDIALPTPFPRLTWEQAMARYGCDKPDTRFGLELCDVTTLTRGCGFGVFEQAECVSGLCVPPVHAAGLSRSQMDKLTALVKQRETGGAKGLAWTKVDDQLRWTGAVAKNVSQDAQSEISQRMGAEPGSVLMFIADAWATTHAVLSNLRLHLRDQLQLVSSQNRGDAWNFLWVTDFPLFEKNDKGHWVSSHHPFTAPRPEHLDAMSTDPGRVRAQAYDLVLNGNEIGGGSIRIHQSEVQARVFAALGLSEEDAQRKFGFLLEAFKYGPPPHGGIALGLDRVAMLMCGAESLRDVIAFPKTQRGQDLMTSCPTPVESSQLEELGIIVDRTTSETEG